MLHHFGTTKDFFSQPKFQKDDKENKIKKTFELFEHKVECVEAPEPTDIIYENL